MQNLIELLKQDGYTIVTGNRRPAGDSQQVSIRDQSDLLLAVGWYDFALLGMLPCIQRCPVVPDEKWFERSAQEKILKHPLLSIGAPDVNYVSLILNGKSLFRFKIDNKAFDDLMSFFKSVSKETYENQLAFFITHHETIEKFARRLCPYSLMDPFAEQLELRAGIARQAHGIVSLCEHPDNEKPCILAGGMRGVATACAVSLLAGNRIYDPKSKKLSGLENRPLGGVFRRKDNASQEHPDHVLRIHEEFEWVTPPYSVKELIETLEKTKDHIHRTDITLDDIGRQIKLIKQFESLKDESGEKSKAFMYNVIIPVGGMGSRMSEITGGKISKIQLPLPTADYSSLKVIDWVIHRLKATKQVNAVLLLSSNKWYDTHKTLGVQLSQKHGLPILVRNDSCMPGSSGEPIFKALPRFIDDFLPNNLPILYMVSDTLFEECYLSDLLSWFSKKEPLAALACSDVSGHEISKYGMVNIDDEKNRIKKIYEKPSQGASRIASQGILIFSRFLNLNQLIDEYKPSDMVDFINKIARSIPVFAFIGENTKLYDCGGKTTYLEAKNDAANGSLVY